MAARKGKPLDACVGRVEVGPVRKGPGPGLKSQSCTWHPPAGHEAEFLPGYRLEMIALTGRDGCRRFVPAKDLSQLLLPASAAGLGLLKIRHRTTPQQRFSHHVMQFIFQWSRLFTEYLGRAFRRLSDLTVCRGNAEASALPEGVGQDERGCGKGWSPKRLVRAGREAGGESVTEADCVRLGLLAAARRNPLPLVGLTAEAASKVVRMALFDFAPTDPVPTATVAGAVEERLLAAIERHDQKDGEKFWGWLFGDLDNVVHAIAKQKKGGGPIPRPAVRSALLDLTFRSFHHVGAGVAEQFHAFAAALPAPLTEAERRFFDVLYTPSPYWGGLPLVLLRDRLPFLREAIFDLLERPADEHAVGVVLRLLDWYGQMARRRRIADREAKRPLLVAKEASGSDGMEEFTAIATVAIRRAGYRCQCRSSDGWIIRVDGKDIHADPISLSVGCQECGEVDWRAVSRSEFEAAGR